MIENSYIMKKNTIKSNINEIKKIAGIMPKTINESLNFEGDESMGYEDEMDSHVDNMPAQDTASINVEKYIDEVRKTALKGMAQLADEPENWGYQTLKKLWQICDKKPEEGQQMQQQPQRPM